MFQRDYIQRMLDAVAQVIARVLRLIAQKKPDEAEQALGEGYSALSIDRELLLMIAWERLSHDEVAAIVGIPTGTVRSRLHRIRRQLDHRVRRTP